MTNVTYGGYAMARNKAVISKRTKKVASTLATAVYIAMGVFGLVTVLSLS